MKFTDALLIAAVIVLLIVMAMISGGCSILQPRANPGDALADLPTTGTEAMFQTLKKANWLYTLSIVGVGAGFFAFLNGSSKGIQVMASCFVVLSLIIGMTKYSAVIAAIAMIGAVCLMIYSTVIKGKALREVVAGVQDVREAKFIVNQSALPNSSIGMAGAITEMLDSVQSKTTKAIVKAVKGKL